MKIIKYCLVVIVSLGLYSGNLNAAPGEFNATQLVMASKSQTSYWNRKENKEEVERVYGASLLNWIYGTRIGQKLADVVLSKSPMTQLCGNYYSSSYSQSSIHPFISNYGINIQEYEDVPYSSFNEFFIRRFRPGVRSFIQEPEIMGAFAEARYFAYDQMAPDQTVPVKGRFLTAAGLLGDAKKALPFENGPLLLARLAPVDYHRFHFPDSGRILESYRIRGNFQSVNPVALKYKQDILHTNERQVTLLETENFGLLAYVEVGALCVGKIVQTHMQDEPFKRGDEKGYFLFGGSTVVVLGQPGKWKPDADLVSHTQQGQETLIQLGDRVGQQF